MARRGKINEVYDISALEKQQERVIQLMNQTVDAINAFPKAKIELEGAEKTKAVVDGMKKVEEATKKVTTSLGTTAGAYDKMIEEARKAADAAGQSSDSYTKNIQKLLELKKQYGETSKAVKTLTDFFNANKGAQNDDLTRQLVGLTAEQKRLKLAVQETEKAVNNQNKELNNAAGSNNQVRSQINQLVQAYDALSEVGKNDEGGKALEQKIAQLEATLQGSEAATGRFQRNVGNYSGAVKVLEGALQEVKQKLDDYNKSGKASADVIEQLVKEEKLLEQLVNNQVNGFASATQELRNNEKALQALGAAGLQQSDFYKDLLKETAELKDNVGDLKNEIKNLASDTGTLDGLVQGAQTLAGAYGIAQGTAALFGEENEELQKTMVKLQAVMTILTGLQGIQNALQKDSSLRLLINNGLQRISVIQTNLQTAAESKNIIVKYASIVAQKALNAVMALTPTGALLAGLTGLVLILTSFASKTDDATKSQKLLNWELEEGAKWAERLAKADQAASSKRLEELKARYATEKELRDQNIKDLENERDEYERNVERTAQAYIDADKKLRQVAANQKAGREDDFGIAMTDKEKDDIAATIDEWQKTVDIYNDLQTKMYETGHKIELARIADGKATRDELRDLQNQVTQGEILALKRQADIKQNLVDDEKRSYAEREKAAKSFAAIQLSISKRQRDLVVNDPRTDEVGRLEAEQKFTDEKIKIERAANQKLYDLQVERLTKQYELTQREKAAAFDLARTNIETALNAANEIIQNENSKSGERLQAVVDFYKKNEQLIKGQMEYELDNTKLLESEKNVIRAKANAQLMENQRLFLQQYTDMSIEELRKQNARVESQLSTNQKNQQAQLLRGLRDSLRFQSEFYSEQEQLQDEQEKDALVLRARNLEKERSILILHGKDVTEINNQIADTWVAIEQKTNDILQKIFESRIAMFQKVTGMALDIFSTIGSALDISNEKEKNRIQEQIDLLEKKKQTEIETANATIANEQDKAAAITVIEKRAQAQREQLEFRQRQIDQKRARFQKAMTVAQIIADTAAAVMKTYAQSGFFGGLGGAIAVGALGAAKLAIALATPIPKYKHGTEDHKGGLAVVGDGGKREVIQTPSGKSYVTPDRPTLVSMPRHSKVLPDADAVMEGLKLAAFKQLPAERVNENNYAKEMTAALTSEIRGLRTDFKRKKDLSINITRYGQYLQQKKELGFLKWRNDNMQS